MEINESNNNQQEKIINAENNKLSEIEIQEINESLAQKEGSSVKGKVIWLDDFPDTKEEVSFHLAIALEDEESLAWYGKLARERRKDLLKNCLRLTLEAFKKGNIRQTKAAYFAGVVKWKTLQQERLEEYKRKHYKLTTLYGYEKKYYEKR